MKSSLDGLLECRSDSQCLQSEPVHRTSFSVMTTPRPSADGFSEMISRWYFLAIIDVEMLCLLNGVAGIIKWRTQGLSRLVVPPVGLKAGMTANQAYDCLWRGGGP